MIIKTALSVRKLLNALVTGDKGSQSPLLQNVLRQNVATIKGSVRCVNLHAAMTCNSGDYTYCQTIAGYWLRAHARLIPALHSYATALAHIARALDSLTITRPLYSLSNRLSHPKSTVS